MEGVILLIKPSRQDFAWYQGLRRPPWLSFASSIPLLWLLIQIAVYLSCLVSWQARSNWNLVIAYLVLLGLVEGRTWLLCRSRRLAAGMWLGLLGWAYGLILAVALLPISVLASLLLLPYLLWAPVEALVTREMRRLNQGC